MTAALAPEQRVADHKPLSLALKLTWACGQIGPYTVMTIISAQLMVYLTNYVGIASALAGAVFATAKLYDAVSDFVIGLASDRTKTRWGRRRPWLIAGSILLAASLLLVFQTDAFAKQWQVVSATAFVFLFFTAFSLFTVPHMAIAAEVSPDYHERTTLQAYATAFLIAGALIGTSLAPILIEWFGGGLPGYHRMALVLSPPPLIAGLVCFFGTAKAPDIRQTQTAKIGWRAWVTTLVGNRPLLALFGTKLMHYFATACLSNGILYYSIYVLGLGQNGLVVFGFASTVGGIVGVLVAARFGRRFRKHRVYAAVLVGMALSIFSLALIPAHAPLLTAIPPLLLSICSAPANIMAQSMVADVVEVDSRLTGINRAGAVSSLVSTVQKASPALGTLVVGLLLSAGGYISAPHATQPASAIAAIHWVVVFLPGLVLLGAAAAIFSFYHLDEGALHRCTGDEVGTAGEAPIVQATT